MTVAVSPATAAKQAFKQRVRHWACKLDVPVVWLAIRPMRQKWASCSTNGHLHFSTELLSLDPELWDYVIVHELLHFNIPNHGRLWKALMRAHLGDWEAAAERLKHHVAGHPHPCPTQSSSRSP
jgi:predicted metal-dependent hydrolase